MASDTHNNNAVVSLLHAATTVMAAAFCLSIACISKRGTGDCFIEISKAGQRCKACCFAPPFPPSDPKQIYLDQGGFCCSFCTLSSCAGPQRMPHRTGSGRTKPGFMGGQARSLLIWSPGANRLWHRRFSLSHWARPPLARAYRVQYGRTKVLRCWPCLAGSIPFPGPTGCW